MTMRYPYVIVGAGMAGRAAIQGIREIDASSEILVIGDEPFFPYSRPPLSKGLWRGGQVGALWESELFDIGNLDYQLGSPVTEVDPELRTIRTATGFTARYGKLLLTVGGRSRRLPGSKDDVYYPGTLTEHLRLARRLADGPRQVIVVGGGFIGSEMAAALSECGHHVFWITQERQPFERMFPPTLREQLLSAYRDHGVEIIAQTRVEAIESTGRPFVVAQSGNRIPGDIVVVGAGWLPNTEIADSANLLTPGSPGIPVDAYGCTQNAHIFAAGDIARLEGEPAPIMHEDRAVNQGRVVGRNMAGAHEVYAGRPCFYSDIYAWGYEAVGRLDTQCEIVEDWARMGEEGVIYYLDQQRLVGILNWNVWNRVDAARALLDVERTWEAEELRGQIDNRGD